MLPICQVCLRTERKLITLEENLTNWHDELCDFAIEDFVQFCTECAYLVKKFYDFKEKCHLATQVLKNWKKQKPEVKKPLSLLHNQIPPSSLSLCNRKNLKVYYYRDSKRDKTIDSSNVAHPLICDKETNEVTFNNPHILTVNTNDREDESFNTHIILTANTNDDDDTNNLQINHDTSNELIKEVKLEDCNVPEYTDTLIFTDLGVKNDINNENNRSENENVSECSDFDIEQLLNDTAIKSDSDSSDDEVTTNKRRKTLADLKQDMELDKKAKKTKRVKNKKPFSVEVLKSMLKKFTKFEVKDEEGNVIDIECIMNSLDKMHIYTLNQIKNRIAGTTELNAEALRVLSRVQKKYGNQYSSVFTVEHLATKEQIMAEFAKRQYYEAYVMSEHKCESCYRGFKHKKLLEYHVKMYHDANQPHLCTVCKMRFKNRHALLKHRTGHRAAYKCKLCPLVTNYRTAMVNHYHQHKGVIYACELCRGTFKSKSCLSAHMNYMHQSQHICSLCARTFASKFGLSQHRLRKHENETMGESPENRSCEQCNVTFISEEVYQKHLEKSHADKKNNTYVYKRRTYVTPRTKPNFICRVCNVTEHSIGRLMWHFKEEHPTVNFENTYSDVHKHLCHVCGKGYASITDLNEHKHLHTGAKPYACDKCPKAFHRKINLRNHLERHLPPARECQQCGKKFVSAANLNNHMKMHIGVRHYTCELCAKSFLHRSALNAHVRGVHHHIRRARKHAIKDN